MVKKKRKKKKSGLFKKPHSRKAGLPPGSILYVGDEDPAKSTDSQLIQYNDSAHREEDANNAVPLVKKFDKQEVNWLNIEGLSDPKQIQKTGEELKVHPLLIEDILNTEHRPKFEPFDEYVFFTLKSLHKIEEGEVSYEQISFLLGKDYVVSFQEKKGDMFQELRERLKTEQSLARKKGSDYLFYRLIDIVVDNYFVVLENLGENIEYLEDEVYASPSKDSLKKIQELKKELIFLRKALYPLRESISKITKEEPGLINQQTHQYFKDVHDHSIYLIDTVETYRDLVSGLMDMYMTSLSNKMNEVMKVLTIIATIFIPLTFIAGIYGMNFEYMPELQYKWAYPAVWILMLIVAIAMILFFKRKKWL